MGLPLQQDLDQLHREILSLSGLVEEMVEKSTRALARRDLRLADDVIDADELVDRREVRIEENCLKALALHQPVAADLRRIATILKVDHDKLQWFINRI
ncbi:MAG: PhoU domain-containing protein [Pirellulaceae bacterium]